MSLRTIPHDRKVEDYLNPIQPEKKPEYRFAILNLMKEVTGAAPKMSGDSIIGFGTTHDRYATTREGDWFLTGFAPRKQNLTL